MITIVDYGLGNLGSLLNMFKRINVKVSIESEPEAISKAEKIVLPGVGSFDSAMKCIMDSPGLKSVLDRKALSEKIPILGICLGMQLLTDGSEEGSSPGLKWVSGYAKRFPSKGLKVPHMGWNIAIPNIETCLTKEIGNRDRYYFVHSYYVKVDDPSHSLMRTKYIIDFDSAIQRENIYGVQFHPEKSHRFGMKLLKNFSEI